LIKETGIVTTQSNDTHVKLKEKECYRLSW